MGFLDAMKGANNSWGVVTGNFIEGIGYIGPKNLVNNTAQEIMISGTGLKESIIIGKKDVERVETLFATSEWIKFRMILKDGKEVIATILAVENSQRGKAVSMNLLNFEYWLADVIYK